MKQDAPECIGIILDGNRRWAKAKGLPALDGHTHGMQNIAPIAITAKKAGVEHMIVYAFSTENWKRSSEEVDHLFEVFEKMFRESFAQLPPERIAVKCIGQRERLPQTLQESIAAAEKRNPASPLLTLWICLSYGGRVELVQAAQKASSAGKITEESLAENLWTAGMPDPDIIIRPGGEKRLSNFLLWQAAYSELFFIDTYWPDFTSADLGEILKEYAARERRIGA